MGTGPSSEGARAEGVRVAYAHHAWEKVVFDPWRRESWDVNDTVLVADPRTDPDVGIYFTRLPEAEFLPTWHSERASGALGTDEANAAAQTETHAATPTVGHADSLGRTFLTIAHNRFERDGVVVEERYATRVVFDIEGNHREVVDARDRQVMRAEYDLLGSRVRQASMDAGERRTLLDVTGQPIFAWDGRDHRLRTTYDAARRATGVFMREGVAESLVSRTVYGEGVANAEAVPTGSSGSSVRGWGPVPTVPAAPACGAGG